MEKHQEPPGKESVPWKAALTLAGASAAGCVFGMIVGLIWSLVQPSRSGDTLAAIKSPPQVQVTEEESPAKSKVEQKAKDGQVVKLTEDYLPSPVGKTFYFEYPSLVLTGDKKDARPQEAHCKLEYTKEGRIVHTEGLHLPKGQVTVTDRCAKK